MAKNYEKLAEEILVKLGGEKNIRSVAHCMTRLRFRVKDEKKVKLEELKQVTGIIQVMVAGGQYQVVIGTDVGDVYDIITATTSIRAEGDVENEDQKGNRNIVNILIDGVSTIFMPIMPALIAASMIKAIIVILTTFSLVDPEGTTYTLLYAAGDGLFYFLPLFLAYTAGKKFHVSPFVSMAIAAALVYPNITALSGTEVELFGLHFTMAGFTSTIIPIIVSIYIQSLIDRGLKKVMPKIIQNSFVPLIEVLVTVVISYLVIGPVVNLATSAVASGITFLIRICPPLAGFVLAALWPILIIFGLHLGLLPIAINNVSSNGYDLILPIVFATCFSILGACLGIFLKTKNSELKEVTSSALFSGIFGGVTEPAIYGAVLKYKRPFVIACLVNGVSGLLMASTNTVTTIILTGSFMGIPALIAMYGAVGSICMCITFVGSAFLTYFFGYSDNMITKKQLPEDGAAGMAADAGKGDGRYV